jgi:hypothetical protein
LSTDNILFTDSGTPRQSSKGPFTGVKESVTVDTGAMTVDIDAMTVDTASMSIDKDANTIDKASFTPVIAPVTVDTALDTGVKSIKAGALLLIGGKKGILGLLND